MIDYNFVPETLEWCTKHYVPPIKSYIICPYFGQSDGTNGACWHCMEMTPYQYEMCRDEWDVRSLLSPYNKYYVETREEAAEIIEKRKQEHPYANLIEYLYDLHTKHQETRMHLNTPALPTDHPCYGCCHYDGCGYFNLSDSNKTEEENFIEHCVGCCCGDGCKCNRASDEGCSNYEIEPILG